MMPDELSRALRGPEVRPDPSHRDRLEQRLLAAYDARVSSPRAARPWSRRMLAAGAVVVCLTAVGQLPTEYPVEVGKRVRLALPPGATTASELPERIGQAFVADGARNVEVKAKMRRTASGAMLSIEVWGDRLLPDAEAMTRLRRLPEMDAASLSIETLEGRIEDNLAGSLRRSLFRLPASPEERELARQRLIEELRRREGDDADVDVDVDEDGSRVRVRVQKRAPAGDVPPGDR